MLRKIKSPWIAVAGITLLCMVVFGPVRGIMDSNSLNERFHTSRELQILRQLTHEQNTLFAGSGLCEGCHGHDPLGLASVRPNGEDVNVVDDWRATMMANSAKDPLWRAKVSHEVLVNPAHQLQLEGKCLSCHAPQGKFNAAHHGLNYTMNDLITDSLGLDGVSCGACHQQDPILAGKFFSGNLVFDTTKTVYGPYVGPFTGPMQQFIGINVDYGAHIRKSELCASCHTLITETVDLSGVLTGGEFVEQATYHEWLNSRFAPDRDNITCQSCHMPSINENIILAANYDFLGPRRPYGLHHLVGGNSFMLKLMKANKGTLGISANDIQFDSTIARTNRLLQRETLELTLAETSRTTDTAFYTLRLQNLTGHKFPSGYPARRAFIQFLVIDENGDTLFKNGLWDSDFEIIGHDAVYEPHRQTIRQEQDVQIYEMVMGDVLGNKTTVLERAAVALKDNRLVPQGFSTTHSTYDTTKIEGLALTDPDFNHNAGIEGSGADVVHYNIPLDGYTGELNVIARVYYQSVPARWLQEMFAFSSVDIDAFKAMFLSADHTPVLVAQAIMGSMFSSVNDQFENTLMVFPNPASNYVFVKNVPSHVTGATIYDMSGRVLKHLSWLELMSGMIDVSDLKGMVLLVFESPQGNVIKRVVVR